MLTGEMPYAKDNLIKGQQYNVKELQHCIILQVGSGIINPLTSAAMRGHSASTEIDVKDFLSKCFEK